ncbi:MAG: glycosyltransferase [Thermotogae bacterium]|nr:glycosyltransferase [Thermotogota bacterium]
MISAIVPMRNEEENAEECLLSLKRALEESGEDWEIIVVDDASHDSTSSIVRSLGFAKLLRIDMDEKPPEAVGKNYALLKGYAESRGDVLLFMDADVRLSPYSLRRLLRRFSDVDMLSVSPEQMYGSPWEASLQPMIFKLLGELYPPEKVASPDSRIAAANGQFILIRREAYEAVGTHRAILGEVLEDVRLAEMLKRKGFRILLLHGRRFGVKARMYRSLDGMVEGWAKNLMLLLRGNVRLGLWYGLWNLFESLAGWSLTLSFAAFGDYAMAMGTFLLANLYFAYRFKSHHPFYTLVHSTVGSALFLYVLHLSYRWYRRGWVMWRGRRYSLDRASLKRRSTSS